MSFSTELAALYRRDLTRLRQEVAAFDDESLLWQTLPGVSNSAGNLTLHLEGNLREFIGRLIGGLPYQRQRDLEFSSTGVPQAELLARIDALGESIPAVIAALTEEQLDAEYRDHPPTPGMSTRQLVIHLQGHLNYHLGQVDYLRRIVTKSGAIALAGL